MAARVTAFVSGTQLTAAIPAADIAAGGTAQVTVKVSDGSISNALTFSIFNIARPTGQYFGEYYNNIDLSGSPTFTRCESSINYNWGTGGPGSGIGTDNFSVRWTGSFNFAAGGTTVTATADDGIRVWVDTNQIINGWVDQSATTYSATPSLTEGAHVVTVEDARARGRCRGSSQLAATADVMPGREYLGEYFNNISLSGSPTFTRCESSINYNWGMGGPGNGIGTDNFSVRWTGSFNLASGSTTFTATADDGIRVWVDANQIINAWVDQSATITRRPAL